MKLPTTGIGSLPHHNIDSAIEYSFRFDLPFLPQLPLKSSKEFMLFQALHHHPALVMDTPNEALFDLKAWVKNKNQYEKKLNHAIESEQFEEFLPDAEVVRCFKAFLFECEERNCTEAKIQIAGPLTCQVISKLVDGEPLNEYPDLLSSIFKTVYVQAAAMVQIMIKRDIKPVLIFDEPGLYALSVNAPLYLTAFNELKITLMSMKKMGAKLGLHICANTDWPKILELPLDFLSFDFRLSIQQILESSNLDSFLNNGGRFFLGVIPTSQNSQMYQEIECRDIFKTIPEDKLSHIIEGSYLSPACGLAYVGGQISEKILNNLKNIQKEIESFPTLH
jgi:methionine synthase II (cobalamin-independent)